MKETSPTEQQQQQQQSKSRLLTPEFFLWYLVSGGIYVGVFYSTYLMSERFNYQAARRFTREGWIPNHRVDVSDAQYRQLRTLMPYLFILMSIWVLISTIIRKYSGTKSPIRMTFYVISSLGLLWYLHSRAMILAIIVSLIHFAIPKLFGKSKLSPMISWIFNIGITIWMYYYHGGSSIHLLGWVFDKSQVLRWHTIFKIPLLRMLSFSLDYYWALNKKQPTASIASHSELERQQEEPRKIEEYDFLTYFIYVFYLPLYLAGPVLTYNAFVAQLNEPQKTISLKGTIKGILTVAFYCVCFDAANHFMYGNGINQFRWWIDERTTPLEIAALSLFMMNWMWMKFLIIWRFFRLFSVLDGFNTHENMPRCISMIGAPSVMWRSWHASFNQWTVRYIYMPLGGRKYQWISAWIIFIYVAMWHDIELEWLAWGIFNCSGLFIEMALRNTIGKSSSKWSWVHEKWYWRHIKAFGSVLAIDMLIVSNLAIYHGFEYTPILLKRFLFSKDSWKAIAVSSLFLFSSAQLQMEIRNEEARHNHSKRN